MITPFVSADNICRDARHSFGAAVVVLEREARVIGADPAEAAAYGAGAETFVPRHYASGGRVLPRNSLGSSSSCTSSVRRPGPASGKGSAVWAPSIAIGPVQQADCRPTDR